MAPASIAATALAGALLDLGDEPGDLLGRATGALGELADLVRDDREALAHLARAGRLDGGVEREQVGLLGDVVDRLDDRADLLALGTELGDLDRGLVDRGLDAGHARDGSGHGGGPVGRRRRRSRRRGADLLGGARSQRRWA